MSKLKSFIRWKENEGTAGMTTARPFIHDPVRNFSKVPPVWFSPPCSSCQAAFRCRKNGTVSCRPAGGKKAVIRILGGEWKKPIIAKGKKIKFVKSFGAKIK